MSETLPPLRPELDFMPSPVSDRPGLLIRDPFLFSDVTLIIPPPLVQALRCFDGQQSDLDLRQALVQATGEFDVSALQQHLIDTEQADFLKLKAVKVEIQKRLALPLACLVLGLFSVPVACVFHAFKQQYGIVLALGVFLVYYSLLSVAESLGESQLIPPFIGVWLPNLLFLGTGLLFLRQAVRERVPSGVLWVLQKLRPRSAA